MLCMLLDYIATAEYTRLTPGRVDEAWNAFRARHGFTTPEEVEAAIRKAVIELGLPPTT